MLISSLLHVRKQTNEKKTINQRFLLVFIITKKSQVRPNVIKCSKGVPWSYVYFFYSFHCLIQNKNKQTNKQKINYTNKYIRTWIDRQRKLFKEISLSHYLCHLRLRNSRVWIFSPPPLHRKKKNNYMPRRTLKMERKLKVPLFDLPLVTYFSLLPSREKGNRNL